ncbi:integral membrane domain protein [Collimonas fungivorans]|jgi:integral membrane protein|uniref:Integral membrane domain protein n=2 Tax=Collimonas fungivorans TaxID=158899 RepID=A0A127P640_9BURK|nr:integral membrane domain protein [Collimonas fungivorans]
MEKHDLDSLKALRQLRMASIIEGASLLILLGIAVPLKHVAGIPAAVAVMGPLHGLTFIAYVWLAVNVISGAKWSKSDAVRILLGAVLPFGGFFNARFIRQHELALASSTGGKAGHP